jgi:hypothetical protein
MSLTCDDFHERGVRTYETQRQAEQAASSPAERVTDCGVCGRYYLAVRG